MQAEVRSIISSDFDERTWRPDEEDNFSFWIQVFVGPAGEAGEEQFQALVCTPKWLVAHHDEEDVLIGWPRVLMFTYDWQRLERTVRRWVSSWHADDWPTLALHVARLGAWEFDGFDPDLRVKLRMTGRNEGANSSESPCRSTK